MRVLFQIFSGAATDISVASTHSKSHQSHAGWMANSHFGFVATASATRPSSKITQASSGSNSQDILACRTNLTMSRGIFKNVNGPKSHKSSLFGIACRINPPSNPAVAAAGIASHSCPASAGMVMIAPPIGPTTRPPSKPIKNAPSSDKSANRYGNPTRRSETPRINGGVINNISFNFWSGSRSSVNNTRRKVFHRASSAAIEDATPTFSSSVNSRSLTDVSVSIATALGPCVTLANLLSEVKRRERSLYFSREASHFLECGSLACLQQAGRRFRDSSRRLPNNPSSRHARRLQPFPLHLRPDVVAAQILPHATQTPEHMHLPVRKMFEKTVADQPHHILPIVIALVGDFLLQNSPNGNDSSKGVTKKKKLQKESTAQNAKHESKNNGDDTQNLNHRSGELKHPQIWQRKTTDSAVAGTKQHAARQPQHIKQSLLPPRALSAQRLQVRRSFGPA